MRKSKGKRLLSLLLTLCMVISLVPATAFAADTTPETIEMLDDVYTHEAFYNKLGAATYQYAEVGTTNWIPLSRFSGYEDNASVEHGKTYLVQKKERTISWSGIVETWKDYATYQFKTYHKITVATEGTIPTGGGLASVSGNKNDAVPYEVYKNDNFTLKFNEVDGYDVQVQAGADAWVTATDGEFTSAVDASETWTYKYVEKAKPKYSVTVNANSELGTFSGVGTGEYTEGDTFTLTATPYNEKTVENNDKDAYVKSVKINGTPVEGTYSGTVFTANNAFTVTAETTVDIEFAQRTLVKKADLTVEVNGSTKPSGQIDTIETAIKNTVISDETLGYTDATVEIYGDIAGFGVIKGYATMDDWNTYKMLDGVFDIGGEELVKITLSATDVYPSISEEGIKIKVKESRPAVKVDVTKTAEVALEGDSAKDKTTIENAVKTAVAGKVTPAEAEANLKYTVNDYTAPTVNPATGRGEGTATVTVTADATEQYQALAGHTITVPIVTTVDPAEVTVTTSAGGTVTVQKGGNTLTAENGVYKSYAGKLTITVKPAKGYYIDTVNGGEYTGTDATYTYTLDVLNDTDYTVDATFKQRVLAVNETADVEFNPAKTIAEQKTELLQEIFNKVVKTAECSEAITLNDVTIKYKAGLTGLSWQELDYDPSGLSDVTQNPFPTEPGKTATIKITWAGEGKYPTVEKEVTITLKDSRDELHLTAATEFEAASPETAEVEEKALTAAKGVLPEGVELEEGCTFDAPTELPATVVVTFTTKGNATYQPGKVVVTVTVKQAITTADLTVAVNGEGTVNDETDKTFAIKPGKFTLNVEPAEGHYVDYIVVDGNTITRDMMTAGADYAFSYTMENIAAGEKHTVTAYFMKPEIAVASTTATMNYNAFVADVNAQIVKTVPYTVKPEGKVPAGELKIYYQARTAGTLTTELWLEVGTDLNKLEYLGAHAFGKTVLGATSATESVRYEYVLADGFKVTSGVITLSLTDERAVTEIRLNPEAVEVTYGQFTADQLKAALLDGVYAGESKIEGAEVTFEKDPTKLNAGDEVEVTLKYAGTAEYQDSTVTTKIKINKAPVTVTVNSAMVKYGTSYGDLVTTDPADVKTIDLIIGLDAASLQLDGEGSVTGVETVINMRLPDKIQSAFDKIGLTNGADMTLTQAIGLLENGKGLMATLGVSEETVDMLVTSMKSLRDQFGEVRIAVGAPLPTNIGAYLVAGIAADENYQTAIDVGYLAITPNGQRAYLDWKIHDENGAVALPAIQSGSYDLSAYVTEVAEGSVEEATKELEHIFFGVDKDGNILLTQDQKDLDLGAYTELAFILNWGNEMYYAEPIARAFVVVPKYIPVTFVDENGNVNPDRSFTYDGKEHGMKAVVEGVAEPGANLTVTYRGVQTDGTVYESTTPPVNAGAYAVTAIYVEKDANGTITGMGFVLGAMKINLSGDATITVEDFVQKTYDGEGYDISSMITSAPDDAARLIITSSIDTTGDVSVNGLEGIGNNVNMDFPDRVDKVLSGIDFFKPAYNGEGLTVNNFVDWIKANEAVFTGMNLDAAKVSALTDLLAKLPDNTKVKFDEIETVSPSSVGAYVVVGLILDPNYKPVADTGMLVIVPDAEQVTLKYEEDFNGNNIFTPEALKYIDLDAAAYNEDDTLNAEATALVQNVYAGIDAQGNEVLTTDWTTLKTGVYTEYSYLLAMGNKTYYAVPVSRTFIIAPDVITVKFVDGNDDPNYIRKFTYDGTPHAMEAVATNASGNVVTDGDMIVKYIGISGDGEGYNSTTAPTKAGVYTVTATYVEKNEDGSVAAAGFAAGAMAIEKAESTFDIADTTVTYDGEGHFVTVTNNENAKYVALIANRADKTVNVQIPEEFDAIVAELPASVDVKELKDVLNKAINKVFGYVGENVTMPENFQTKLDALLTEVETLMAEVPNVTVTFNEENPVNAGTYEVYVVTYAANHNSTYDKANLEITKRPVTITADDQEVIVGNAEPEYTYSVTEGSIVEGDELVITVDCPSYEDVVGTYEIVATCEAHANYEVTAVNGTLTVTEKPVVPVTGVTLNSTTAALEIGETTTLTATVEPADASVQGVTWTSSDESVATVDENGVVTAVGEGEAIITATTVDGAYTADCTVTVTAAAVTGYTVSGDVTSYLEETDTVTIQLIPEGSEEAAYETTMVGNTGTYSMEGVAAGTYTLKASKAGHVISEYAIDVNGDVVQDVVLAILGDVTLDLKVNMDDVVALLRHVVRAEIINEPASLAAGEVTYDDNLNMDDVVKLLRFVVRAIGSLE